MQIPERERRRLAELAQRPVDVHTGTPYPCHQSDIDLCRRTRGANHHRLHRMEATYQLTKFNRITKELSPVEDRAYRNIKNALQLPGWGPDLAIKAFKDLDQLFFMGRLHGRALLGWSDPAACIARVGSYRTQLGVTSQLRPGTVRIMLNIHMIMFKTSNPYIFMWSTLLQYISKNNHTIHAYLDDYSHAYEMIMCGNCEDLPYDVMVGSEEWHGIHFCTQIQAVHRRAKKLLGLNAIDPGDKAYRLDRFDRSDFENFFIETANKNHSRRAWELYNEDLPID